MNHLVSLALIPQESLPSRRLCVNLQWLPVPLFTWKAYLLFPGCGQITLDLDQNKFQQRVATHPSARNELLFQTGTSMGGITSACIVTGAGEWKRPSWQNDHGNVRNNTKPREEKGVQDYPGQPRGCGVCPCASAALEENPQAEFGGACFTV